MRTPIPVDTGHRASLVMGEGGRSAWWAFALAVAILAALAA
ncbi:MAG: hypothetical protein QM704_10905 [Anaeromyxobacteraceae bacterium]